MSGRNIPEDDYDDLDEDVDESDEDEDDEPDEYGDENGEDDDIEEGEDVEHDASDEYDDSAEGEEGEDEDEELNDDSEEEEELPEYEEGLVYVIMPFSDEHLNEVYRAISSECSELDLNAQIASEAIGSGLVIQKIRDLAESAEFIICDLTGERPNVYYELGQAHGLGNDAERVLLIAKEGTPLHFNVAPLHVYYYQSTEHLRQVIASQLGRMIQYTRS